MTTPNHQSDQPPNRSKSTEDETFDVRDLVSKPNLDKDPREIIENPAVTPQMPEEASDSQVGIDRSDRNS